MTVRSEEIDVESEYANVTIHTVKKPATTPGQKFPSLAKFLPLLAVCWVTLLIITSFCIYFTFDMSENKAKLNVQNQQLKTLMEHLIELQEIKIANVTEENQNLKTQNQQLETQNQELKRQKKDLTDKIQDMETNAQWSIDAYCPKKSDKRQCKPCQDGWEVSQSSCYAINNPKPTESKTWDEAQADCKGKISDLTVIDNQDEKKFINDKSWDSSGTNGYWIGLRVDDGKWKWVDGTNLTETSWIQQHPPTAGHCAISVQNQGWKSVNCGDKKMWICEKAALSV